MLKLGLWGLLLLIDIVIEQKETTNEDGYNDNANDYDIFLHYSILPKNRCLNDFIYSNQEFHRYEFGLQIQEHGLLKS